MLTDAHVIEGSAGRPSARDDLDAGLDGSFTFTLGDEEVEVGPGSFIIVPRGTRHLMRAGAEGGRFLTLWTPGGLETMFMELSRLPADSLRDPETRKLMSTRFDSIPV